jgi:hypothetical protein
MNNGHFRDSNNQDYSIKIPELNGSFYIKPRTDKLIITAHPNVEHLLIALLGQPYRREAPDSTDHACWEIRK